VFILSKDLTGNFLLLFCLPKIKVTKQKGSTNRAYFPLEKAKPTSLRPSHRPKQAALLLHLPPHKLKTQNL
jgi:hypothetical protein